MRAIAFASCLAVVIAGCPSTNSPADDAGAIPDAHGADDAASSVHDAGEGADAHAPVDAATNVDAFRAPSDCTAMRVTSEPCASLCDGPDQWYWDGERCTQIDCGACRGEDCGLGVLSESECLSAHASCVPELCRSTGGDWLFFAEECGHYECGRPVPATCLIGMPVCDCGVGRSFVDGVGCAANDACLTLTTPPETLCTSTGGTWANTCCPSVCGVPCSAECLAPACTCGPFQIFDADRGCIEAVQCHDDRAEGETCGLDTERARCADGLLCCQRCGGAGCVGEPTCRAPVCDDTGRLDVCGNDRLAP